MEKINLKEELANQACQVEEKKIKIKKSMSIEEMIQVMQPEIKRALPSMITPERFTRIALSALNNNVKLRECTPMSFLAALLSAAQLGLEPNTPLGQAYLIPYRNKGILETQFQIGYRGLIQLAYRSGQMQTIQAHSVYQNDSFIYQYGLEPKLIHKPAPFERGELAYFYAFFKTINNGYGFSVMSKQEVDDFARMYSQSVDSDFSPWKSAYPEMAKKTVLKQALKYAPMVSEIEQALSIDESIKKNISEEMYTVENETIENMVA